MSIRDPGAERRFALAVMALSDSVGETIATVADPEASADRTCRTVGRLHCEVRRFVGAADALGLDPVETRIAARSVVALMQRDGVPVPDLGDGTWMRVDVLVRGLTAARLHLAVS